MIDHAVRLGRAAPSKSVVVLVAQAAYHLAELLPLRAELGRRGTGAEIVVPVPPRKPLNRFRPGVRRHHELLASTSERPSEPITAAELVARSSALVVMNDWGVPRPLVEAVSARGRPTFAIQEGVQDFADADTGTDRRPYQRVDHVFSLGRYGAEQLGERSTTVVGSTRLRELAAAPPRAAVGPRATVNSNFTYGTLRDARRPWLRSVAEACDIAGIDWDLSRHVAERGIVVRPRPSRRPIGELLARSSHLVSRFSTVCYEALVRGVDLAYHNPHGEQVPTFREPAGAFVVTSSTAELAEVLARPPRPGAQVRADARRFLGEHLRLEPGPSPARLMADEIVARLS